MQERSINDKLIYLDRLIVVCYKNNIGTKPYKIGFALCDCNFNIMDLKSHQPVDETKIAKITPMHHGFVEKIKSITNYLIGTQTRSVLPNDIDIEVFGSGIQSVKQLLMLQDKINENVDKALLNMQADIQA